MQGYLILCCQSLKGKRKKSDISMKGAFGDSWNCESYICPGNEDKKRALKKNFDEK